MRLVEEGLAITQLERIVASLAHAATEAGVYVVAGDTKVLPRGQAVACIWRQQV